MRISRRVLLRRWLPAAATALLLPEFAGCGSMLYPERIGQPRTGPLDWKVVALDGLGLFLFFVPGLVAFVIDFYNGTIFLPAYEYDPYAVPPTDFSAPPTDFSPPQQNYLPPADFSAPQQNYLPPPPNAGRWPTPAPGPLPPDLGNPQGAAPGAQLPPDPSRSWSRADFETINVPRAQLTQQGIEQILSRRLGRTVTLDAEHARVARLNDLSEFGDRAHQLAAGEIDGLSPARAFPGT
jgi:hypothetical protein